MASMNEDFLSSLVGEVVKAVYIHYRVNEPLPEPFGSRKVMTDCYEVLARDPSYYLAGRRCGRRVLDVCERVEAEDRAVIGFCIGGD